MTCDAIEPYNNSILLLLSCFCAKSTNGEELSEFKVFIH